MVLSSTDCTINMEPDEDVAIIEQSVTTITTHSSISHKDSSTENWKGKPLAKMLSLFNQKLLELLDIELVRAHTVLFNV